MAQKVNIRDRIPALRNWEYQRDFYPIDGLVATDGVQYSSIATFGTTATNIFSKMIDPGFDVDITRLNVGLTQMFTGLNGSFVASIMYYWTLQPFYHDQVKGVPTIKAGTAINIMGTYQKAVGTLTTHEDTFSGDVPVGSVPKAPFLATLQAVGIKAVVSQGKVKNSTRFTIEGTIPGT